MSCEKVSTQGKGRKLKLLLENASASTDPAGDASHRTITGEGMQLCSHKRSCKSEMFEQGQMSNLVSPPTSSLFQKAQGSWFLHIRVLRIPGKLAKMHIVWPHPSSDAEGEPPGCP